MMKNTLIALILLNALTAVLLVKKPVRKPCNKKRIVVVRKYVYGKHRHNKLVRRARKHRRVVRRVVRRIHRKKAAFVVGTSRNLGGEANSWASKVQQGINSQANTEAAAEGNGRAQSFAGPSGAQSQAEGSLGTRTASSFNADSYNNEDSWGRSSGKGAASAWSNKSVGTQKIAAAAEGGSKGHGGSGASAGNDGSQAYGAGDRGGFSGASWGQSATLKQDKWGANSN